jgi:hypothetical protein
MHVDWRAPQFVMQIERYERSGFFLQFVMHVVCSPLHRIGAAKAAWQQNSASDAVSARTKIRRLTQESKQAMKVCKMAPDRRQ